jgi:hypothetical protein
VLVAFIYRLSLLILYVLFSKYFRFFLLYAFYDVHSVSCLMLVDCPERLLLSLTACMCSVYLLWNVPYVAVPLVDAVSLYLLVHWCFFAKHFADRRRSPGRYSSLAN